MPKVARRGWNGRGMFLMVITPNDYSVKISIIPNVLVALGSWIGMKTADDLFVPWLASQTDVLAEDWEIIYVI